MTKEDRMARSSDLFNRFSKHTVVAMSPSKFWDDYLILRKNGTFVYRTKVFGLVNSGYYCGSYVCNNDVLKLYFHYDHTAGLDTSYEMKTEHGEVSFVGKNNRFHVVDQRLVTVLKNSWESL